MTSKSSIYHPIRYSGIIGTLMLLAFLAYGFGRELFDAELSWIKSLGAILILANSAIVLAIGILFRKTLSLYAPFVANLYLSTRIFEAVALGSIVLDLQVVELDFGYFIGMVVLGLGSIPMCLTLFQAKLSPAWLALWGVVGYAIFAVSFLLQILAMDWSIYLLIPAALWEIVFAIWLIRRGKSTQPGKTPQVA
jgi:hypothetical protein